MEAFLLDDEAYNAILREAITYLFRQGESVGDVVKMLVRADKQERLAAIVHAIESRYAPEYSLDVLAQVADRLDRSYGIRWV